MAMLSERGSSRSWNDPLEKLLTLLDKEVTSIEHYAPADIERLSLEDVSKRLAELGHDTSITIANVMAKASATHDVSPIDKISVLLEMDNQDLENLSAEAIEKLPIAEVNGRLNHLGSIYLPVVEAAEITAVDADRICKVEKSFYADNCFSRAVHTGRAIGLALSRFSSALSVKRLSVAAALCVAVVVTTHVLSWQYFKRTYGESSDNTALVFFEAAPDEREGPDLASSKPEWPRVTMMRDRNDVRIVIRRSPAHVSGRPGVFAWGTTALGIRDLYEGGAAEKENSAGNLAVSPRDLRLWNTIARGAEAFAEVRDCPSELGILVAGAFGESIGTAGECRTGTSEAGLNIQSVAFEVGER
jgi:hypothetical protein